jgi:hypothetical protein
MFEVGDHASGRARFVLLECIGCSAPLVVSRDYEGESYEGEIWSLPAQIYPPVEETLGPKVPAPIAASYREARRVFLVRSYDSTALMCRKTIELLCNDLGAIGSDLKKKLEYLKGAGVIDERIHEWSDQILREIGNDAAHACTVNKEDAKDAIEFTKAILDYVYVFMPAFNEFRIRHTKP